MFDNKIVSVIVPVYNVKDYLKECLESISMQTYKDLQIIIIDDGSTDGSGEICKNLSKKDNRIEYIYQINAGVSKARNTGLDYAIGKYVCFVDGDDRLSSNAIKVLVEAACNKDTLVISSYDYIDEKGKHICNGDDYLVADMNNHEALYNIIIPTSKIGYQGFLWNKIFFNSVIKNNNIRFNTEISYNEDRLFVFQYLMTGCCVSIVHSVTYHYRQRTGSAMNSISNDFSINQVTELDAFEVIESQLKEVNNSLYLRSSLACFYCANDLYKRCSFQNEGKYRELKIELKNKMKSRIKRILFSSDIDISLKERCRCIYYWVKIRMRVIK